MEAQKKILIVEDEVALRNAFVEKFVHEGFLALEAGNGVDGLSIAEKERPDLILLDIVMPKMDGMTMLQKLREGNSWGNQVAVVLLTNLTPDDQIIRDITKMHPAYYLVKADRHINDVVERVREILIPPQASG